MKQVGHTLAGAGAGLVRRGKHAVTGAPKRRDLPAVETRGTDSVGDILDRYIAQLRAAGLGTEAATLGTVYEALVHANFASVPVSPLLLSEKEDRP